MTQETYKLAKTENPTPEKFARVRFGNTRYDAFRHALLAIKTTRALGKEVARRILTNHEIGRSIYKNEIQMDKFNDEVRIKAALNPANKNISDVDLAKHLLDIGQLQENLISKDRSTQSLAKQVQDYIIKEPKEDAP